MKKKVLVVDDNEVITKFMKSSLEALASCQVMVANSGSQGIEAARSFNPDIIFLDIVMPDMEGSQVAEHIRKDPSLSNTPIIFLTGIISQEEAEKSDGIIGGQKYLAKPMTREQLVDCINQYARQRTSF